MIGFSHPIDVFLEFSRKFTEASGRDGSMMTPLELWIPCNCMKSEKSDWFSHITWRVKKKTKVSILERFRQMSA